MSTPEIPGATTPEQAQKQEELYELLVKSVEKEKQKLQFIKEQLEAQSDLSQLLQKQIDFENKTLTSLLSKTELTAQLRAGIEGVQDVQAKINELEEQEKNIRQEMAELTENQNGFAEDELKKIQDKIKLLKQVSKFSNSQDTFYDDYLKNLGLESDFLKAKIKDGKTLAQLLEEAGDDEQKQTEALEAAKGVRDNILKTQKKIDGVTKKVTSSIGMSASFSDTFLGKTVGIITNFQSLEKSGINVKKLIGASVLAALNLKNIIGVTVEEVSKLSLKLSDVGRALGASTGQGEKFNEILMEVKHFGNLANISLEDASKSVKALTENLSSFDSTASQSNKNLALTVSRLQKLGVSAETSTKSIDFMQRSMGLSADAARTLTAEIVMTSREVGINGTKALQDFNQAQSRLSIFGSKNIEVFKKLQAQAKATGLSVQSLVKIAEGFDTFDGAADSAAKLNAVLGTQLSTLQLMNATDDERIMMIKQQVKMSVGNFESLDKFTKQYVAQAMGVASVDEAQRLLNMSTAEYTKFQAGQKSAAEVQEELRKTSEQLVPIVTQLKLAFMNSFMMMSPLITKVAQGFQLLSAVIVMVGKALYFIVPIFAGYTIIAKYSATIKILGAAFKFLGISLYSTGIFALIMGIVFVLSLLYDELHKEGSPMLFMMPFVLATGFDLLAAAIVRNIDIIKGVAKAFTRFFKSLHPPGQTIDIDAMAKLDTSKVAAGFRDIKSAVTELANVEVDGFLALKTDGTATSFIMGDSDVISNLSEGRLTVDVNIPEISAPNVTVKVYLDGKEMAGIVHKEFT